MGRGVVVGVLAVGLVLSACAGEPIAPPGAGGSDGPGGSGSPGGPGTGVSGPLPTNDDVLGLPDDAFDAFDRAPLEALFFLGTLTPDEVDQLAGDAASDPEIAVALIPSFIRIYYSDDTMEEGEFGEIEDWEWVLHTTDGTDIHTTAFREPGADERTPMTSPTTPDIPSGMLAEWELTAGEAARIATDLLPGEVEEIGVPSGIHRPLTTVVVEHGDGRSRVTIDAVTSEPLNIVALD